ncbi:AGAP008579-PA-like protein [Anopheles sinensis]|uniref:AGAP008579-PA-like protein n=1 Tax=Anopheles sinensis TaxID=74873 RepID=A0A084VFH1_ANOSI|nr:AGAP008579-PA-like protein [Anopheles sinensis]
MKLIFAITLVCLGVSLSEAGRTASTDVVQKLKEIEPIYKNLQDDIVNAVAGAKLNTASKTDAFYQAISDNKEASLKKSIAYEDEFINQLNNQAPSADSSCLEWLRGNTENNMFVAGVGYTICVNTVEAGLKKELDKVYKLLQVDESELFDLSLLDVFRGENIIADPVKIIAKLNEKASEINSIAANFKADVNVSVDDYATRLIALEKSYKSCVLSNESALKQAIETSKMQLTQICMGTIV